MIEIAVAVGFVLMAVHKAFPEKLAEWPAWAAWAVAAVLWAL